MFRSFSKKPDRFCTYCKKIVSGEKLNRHILRQHHMNDEVKVILTKSKEERTNFFYQKRREGMVEYNLELFKNQKEKEEILLMRERKPKHEDSLKMCSRCNRFLSNRTFYRHRKTCDTNTADPVSPKCLVPINRHKDQEFHEQILQKFRDSEVGKLCQSDELIQQVGYRHFSLRKSETSKREEIRKCVMTEMRELARLFIKFRNLSVDDVSTEDMFLRK
ncbi:uncharacterized protein LOC124135007 [Haliotis rufescens]|uniref:uncharacterized protein LOC124135007 n=1 Tax=Haliotis rufescens TaxID=6454 RepID=UPI00201F6E57|nr:uncharacterized protein LOC124135007 [Haliotis rufescens]